MRWHDTLRDPRYGAYAHAPLIVYQILGSKTLVRRVRNHIGVHQGTSCVYTWCTRNMDLPQLHRLRNVCGKVDDKKGREKYLIK